MKILLTILMIGFMSNAQATPEQLSWSDLIAEFEFDDPFESLTRKQMHYLSIYAQCLDLEKVGEATRETQQNKEVKEAWLRKNDVDFEGLLARREEITELRTKRASAMDETLDGKTIRMPGYALALECDGAKVKEFLLVPWAGACIHTPPPPPNQIVYVDASEAFAVSSRFEPVWIEGVMRVVTATKELYLVDGSADINIGYSMTSAKIEKYESSPKVEVRPAVHPPSGEE